jgi:hypothetical protein
MPPRRFRGRPAARHLVAALLFVALIATGTVLSLNARSHPDQGAVQFVVYTDTAFDQYTAKRDPAYGTFLRSHVRRMVVFSPYFDDKTRWYPNGWVYVDAYAIYGSSDLAARHPEWILRDVAGKPLYIPFECSNGSCPQYAANIANAAFRRYWISSARAELDRGYHGLFIDDVNMEFRVSDGYGQQVAPVDPATRRPMSYKAWRAYMATFVEQIRAALPSTEIVHNPIWFADSPARTGDPYIRREIEAADYINLERGINDPGLTGGSGPDSFRSFLSYIDAVHALGKGVILAGGATDRQGTEYALASYFLISVGSDFVTAGAMTPVHWWSGFDVNLGDALGPRREWSGVLRRDYSRGIVLVNGPGTEPHLVKLPAAMRDLDGYRVTSVTLSPASGAVLTRP